MTLARPNARITIDGTSRDADQAALVRLCVELSLNGSHDLATLQLWPRSTFADAAAGAKMKIALGERGEEEAVWSGEVTSRRMMPQGVALEGLAATVALSRTSKSQGYLNQSVADIVRDLAGNVAIDKVQAPLRLNAYHVDNRRPVWSHLKALAALAGADLGPAPDGGLRFVPASGALSPVTLRHGAELLDWSLAAGASPRPAKVAAYGSASESGDQRWHWLSHDPAGAGAGTTRVPAALSTRDAAQAVGDALGTRAARAGFCGVVVIQGRPALRPGDSVRLADLPGGDPGVLRVRTVRHTFDATGGFLTRLGVEGDDGDEGGGAGGFL